MLKKEIRKTLRQKRGEITATQQLKWDDLILIHFQTIELPFLSTVLSFNPIEEKKEINPFTIIDYLHFVNPALQVAYPKADFKNNSIQAIVCNADAAFEFNEYDIPEPVGGDALDPTEIDMVLVPLLAFDIQGKRVGYGKGFYDRFLKQCRPNCLLTGLSYFEAIDTVDDADDFDVPLNLCITPQKVYVF